MGIATELARIKTAKSNLKTAINAKGGGLVVETLDYYAEAVNALPSGGIAAGVSYDTIDASNNVTTATVYGTFVLLHAFYNNAYLTSVDMPSGITSIGSYGFQGCINLALTSLPSGLISIGSYGFQGCINLVLTSLPSGLISIDDGAFYGCTGLTKVWIPSACASIIADTYLQAPFRNCSSNLKIYCEAASKPAGWGDYWNYYASSVQLTVTWNITLEQFNAL